MTTIVEQTPLLSLTADWVSRLSESRREPAWLKDARLRAWTHYEQAPWPTPKDERWKRTPLNTVPWDALRVNTTPDTALPGSESLPPVLRDFFTPAHNGSSEGKMARSMDHGSYRAWPKDLSETGVECLPWGEALAKHEDRLKPMWIDAVTHAAPNKFHSLALALATGGYFVNVPKGRTVKTPIHIFLAASEPTNAYFSANFIFLGPGAEAQIWEEQINEPSGNKPVFLTTASHIRLEEESQASLYYLQNWNLETVHLQFQNIVQQAGSRIRTIAVETGGRVFHNESSIQLNGKGAENKILGVLFGDQSQNFENWIIQNHTAPNTTSDIQFRGGLRGRARSFFSGLVKIDRQAQRSDAYQSAKHLLLSPDAKADAIPNLEILADDVKCSHGAAVGSVDEDQKFYLGARGIPPAEAEKIIVQGFFDPVIAEMPSEAVQTRLRRFIEEKLNRP